MVNHNYEIKKEEIDMESRLFMSQISSYNFDFQSHYSNLIKHDCLFYLFLNVAEIGLHSQHKSSEEKYVLFLKI